jgi:ApaG protein
MVTQVTHGIRISVHTEYQDSYSRPEQRHFLFLYRISIENRSEFTVQLQRRHWHIFDSSGEFREVEGEGVIGQQPVLAPGEVYEYESACNLTTDMGKMYGTYLMEREHDRLRFNVHIPEFELIVPSRLN